MEEQQAIDLNDGVEDVNPDEEEVPFRYQISAYGADYPVDSLVHRLGTGDIEIPKFQRGFIWTVRQAHRFVESLLLGLPVPGIFLSREQGTGKLLVLDGQQRLRTIEAFYEGYLRERPFVLREVHSAFVGKSYKTLDDEDRRKLDNFVIHATVVKQEVPSEDESSIYFIFERLNTGGTVLSPQEIRSSIYQGPLSELLRRLNDTVDWRALYGRPSRRMKDQELILRFFALYFRLDEYERPMKDFLNDYMSSNRNLQREPETELKELFCSATAVIHESLGPAAFRPTKALNAAVVDAVMVGVARRLTRGSINEPAAVQAVYEELFKDPSFVDAYTRATADEERVRDRIRLSSEAFAEVK